MNPEVPAIDRFLVTLDDHDNGYKEVEVTCRGGKKRMVRVNALCARKADETTKALSSGDAFKVLEHSLGPDDLDIFTKVKMGDVNQLLRVAWALAFEVDLADPEVQKKIIAAGAERQTRSTSAEQS